MSIGGQAAVCRCSSALLSKDTAWTCTRRRVLCMCVCLCVSVCVCVVCASSTGCPPRFFRVLGTCECISRPIWPCSIGCLWYGAGYLSEAVWHAPAPPLARCFIFRLSIGCWRRCPRASAPRGRQGRLCWVGVGLKTLLRVLHNSLREAGHWPGR